MDIVLIVKSMDIRHMNAGQRLEIHLLHLEFKDIVKIVKSIFIEHKNADPTKNLSGHPRRKTMHLEKVTHSIGITIHGISIIIVENMVIF